MVVEGAQIQEAANVVVVGIIRSIAPDFVVGANVVAVHVIFHIVGAAVHTFAKEILVDVVLNVVRARIHVRAHIVGIPVILGVVGTRVDVSANQITVSVILGVGRA